MNSTVTARRPVYTTHQAVRSASAGYLLVDALISLVLLGIVGGMGVAALLSAYEGEAIIDEQRHALADMQRAVSFFERDLAQMIARPIRDEFGNTQASLVIADNQDYALEFTRSGWPNPIEQQRSELQRVAYRLDDDGHLYRAYWLHLDRAQGSEPIEALLLTGVTQFSASAWQVSTADREEIGNRNRQEDVSTDTWPADNADNTAAALFQLPQAVEITIETETFGVLRRVIAVAP